VMLLICLYIHSKSSSLFQGVFIPRTCLYMSSLHHTAEVCRHSSSLQMGYDLLAATPVDGYIFDNSILLSDSRPLPDVALTGKCTRECDEYGHSDSCWMPVRTSPERKQKSQPKLSTFMPVDERGSQEKLANGEASLMGDRNRNLLNKKLTSSYETFSAASFSKNEEGNPEDIPLTQTGEYKPSPVNTLTRREVYL
ncbi:unnamed protein product, partial [Bubo scandiacus]